MMDALLDGPRLRLLRRRGAVLSVRDRGLARGARSEAAPHGGSRSLGSVSVKPGRTRCRRPTTRRAGSSSTARRPRRISATPTRRSRTRRTSAPGTWTSSCTRAALAARSACATRRTLAAELPGPEVVCRRRGLSRERALSTILRLRGVNAEPRRRRRADGYSGLRRVPPRRPRVAARAVRRHTRASSFRVRRRDLGQGKLSMCALPRRRRAAEDGRVELDFNKAYNPPCAFTPFATCLMPLGNRRRSRSRPARRGRIETSASARKTCSLRNALAALGGRERASISRS